MSRFELYGDVKCEECAYYRKSDRCPVWRCDDSENLREGNIGVVYMKRPDDINHTQRCDRFNKNNRMVQSQREPERQSKGDD